MKLLGRLGADVHFKTTGKGTLVARFPLAIRNDDGSTTWRSVLQFGERADKLRGTLSKGQVAEVIGYVHRRDVQTRDGGTRTVEEIYATVVTGR